MALLATNHKKIEKKPKYVVSMYISIYVLYISIIVCKYVLLVTIFGAMHLRKG